MESAGAKEKSSIDEHEAREEQDGEESDAIAAAPLMISMTLMIDIYR
jgi:hypothetical protein